MDKLTIVGLTLALISLVGGSILKGAGLAGLWSPAAFVIVVVGTIAASLVQAKLETFKRAMKIVKWTVNPPSTDREAAIASFIELSTKARKAGVLSLQEELKNLNDPFIEKGVQMVVDGVEPDKIREMLELEAHTQTEADLAAAKFFETAGIYSPTMGIIGAVLGLMAVMKNLSNPELIGSGIAAAFTATIYGIGLANLVLLPFAGKLKGLVNHRAEDRQLAVEALIGIAQAENPRNLQVRLSAFLT